MLTDKELRALNESITNKEELLYKGVLYGEFGTRKTTTALRCARNKAILVHADRGWQVIHNHPDEFPEDKVVPVEYEGLSQFRMIVEAIATGVEPFAGTDLIVVDTISQMQEKYVDFLMENADYGGKFRDSLIPKTGVKNFEKTEIPGMPDYHLARNKLRPIVDLLVQAPVNVIFLAHLREPGPMERANGKLEKRPNITEALYKVIARDATFIGFMSKNNKGEYIIDFEPKNTQSAKSQIPTLTDKKIKAEELPEFLNEWSEK
jgi:hypothetical protein